MAEKRNYVLWVVHTVGYTQLADMRYDCYDKLVRAFKKISKNMKDFREAYEIHAEGVIKAMKLAQDTGARIVYEAKDAGGNRFLDLAEKKEVKRSDIVRMKYHRKSGKAVADFWQIVTKLGIKNFEVIFAGHYGDDCIYKRAVRLKDRGFKPYLLIGTPVVYWSIYWGPKFILNAAERIKEFFGKDRLITLHQFKKLISEK